MMRNRVFQTMKHISERTSFYTAFSIAALGIIGTGCDEPKKLTTDDYYKAKEIELPNAEKYELDIAMITQFNGHINSEKISYPLFIHTKLSDDDNQYDEIYLNIDDFMQSEACHSESQTKSEASIPINNKFVSYEDNKKYLKFKTTPYEEDDLTCRVYLLPESTSDVKRIIPDINIDSLINCQNAKIAICQYEIGGITELAATWQTIADNAKDNKVTQVRVASGDSFGTSAKVSARFNDILAPIALNAANLNIDIFGNHNFGQSLSYLKNVLSWTNYKYVASNLVNVPQNLKGVSPRALVDIPAKIVNEDDEQKDLNPLRVAFVSALDMDMRESVYAGRFGTLDIGNYCNLIQSIEDAYNDGARAFFILAHLMVDNISIKAVLNAISYFHNPTIGAKENPYDGLFSVDDIKTIETDSESTSDNNSSIKCASVLEIPDHLLHEKFKKFENVNSVSDIDISDPEQTQLYREIIEEIHEEIYQGIIGILGESSSEPLIAAIKPSLNTSREDNSPTNICQPPILSSEDTPIYLPYKVSGCTDSNATGTYSFYSHLKNSNLLEDINIIYYKNGENPNWLQKSNKSIKTSCYNDIDGNYMRFMDNWELSCRKVSDKLHFTNADDIETPPNHDNTDNENNDDTGHSILFMEFPSNSKSTSQLRVEIVKKNNSYIAIPKEFTYLPVIKPVNPNSSTELENGLFKELNFEQCTNLLESFENTYCSILPDDTAEQKNKIEECKTSSSYCKNYWDIRTTEENLIFSMDNINQTTSNELNQCLEFLHMSADESIRPYLSKPQGLDNIKLLTDAFNCIYYATFGVVCKDEIKHSDISIFDFGNGNLWHEFRMDAVNTIAENYERTHSVFKTNMVIDSIFNHIQKKSNHKYYLAMTNSGATKSLTSYREITYSNLFEFAPYNTQMTSIKISASELAKRIESVLQNSINTTTSGSYPVFSGIRFSTYIDDNNQIHVQEIWLNDHKGGLIEPIYTKLNNINDNPTTCKNNLYVFGTYEISNNSLIVTFNDSNPFFCLTSNNTYSKCSDITFHGKVFHSNGKTFWAKQNNNQEMIYEIITSKFLTEGDSENAMDLQSFKSYPIPDEEFWTKHYIMSYLNENLASNFIGEIPTDNDIKKQYCNDSSESTDNNINITDELLCSFLTNRHFHINELIPDKDDQSVPTFSQYISSQTDLNNDSKNNEFNLKCNNILYNE